MLRILLLACALLAGATSAATAAEYQLKPGDTILVSVWREDALQREVRVLPDGSITFPLAGRVEAGGLGAPAVAQLIAARLTKYLADAEVTVVITGIEGNRAYVLGKVTKPGPVTMTGPLTVLQILSMAGGLDKFADEGAIKIVRAGAGAQEIVRINYKDLVAGRDMSTNVVLRAGDTVLVP